MFENRFNHERFECDNVRDIETIEGVEYLKVRKPNTHRQLLIRKDSLKKIDKQSKRLVS
jgi:hypothetical protein